MFEQQSYIYEAPSEPLREGDLFYNHEVGEWKFDNRIFAILGISLLLNLSFLGVVAQTNVLMAKGCDSPWVGRVCQVLDMAYVSSVLFGTDREYADAVYERTQMEDVEVTWIDQTGVEPAFQYPEGYFYQEPVAGDPLAMDTGSAYSLPPGMTPMNPVPGGSSLIDTPQMLPKQNPNAVTGKVPDSPFDLSGTDTDTATSTSPGKSRGKKGNANANQSIAQNNTNANTATASPTPDAEDVAKADKFGIYINKRPMKDKAKETLADVEAKKVALDKPFKVTVTGTLGLGKDGKTIVLKNPKPVLDKNVKNDPAMEKLVQDWILAVGDAGWFGYLDKLKAKQLVITIEQNENELVASVKADQPDENYASTAASGLNSLLQIAATQVKDDEKTFLEKANVKSEGKTFMLNFAIPKPVVQDMIQRKLNETAIENKNTVNSIDNPTHDTSAKLN
jgi:hypothetical protein